MFDYLSRERPLVLKALEEGLREAALRFPFPGLARDLCDRLLEYSGRGKTLRGCLVRLGFELCGGEVSDPALAEACRKAGAAMELFQSGLLIHDDIMDRDDMRRGAPTVHVAYAAALAASKASEPAHNGKSLAICAGDLAYFTGFSLLARLAVDLNRIVAVQRLAAEELGLVCVAQARDVSNGSGPGLFGQGDEPNEQDILNLYRTKTGRYTFSLPLAMGATLAGASAEALTALMGAGELLGVAFQLKDDELGILADAAELGKPLGSDLREDKKTILRLRLLNAAGADPALRKAFGNPRAGARELSLVRSEARRLGIFADLAALMRLANRDALELARPVLDRAPEPAANAFMELANYNLDRTK